MPFDDAIAAAWLLRGARCARAQTGGTMPASRAIMLAKALVLVAIAGLATTAAAGDAYGVIGLRLHAASLCAPHARAAAELAGRYARLLLRLDALALELEAAPAPRNDAWPARPLVGTLPIGWPYLGYARDPVR